MEAERWYFSWFAEVVVKAGVKIEAAFIDEKIIKQIFCFHVAFT